MLTTRDEQAHSVRRGLHAFRGEGIINAFQGVAPNPGAFLLCLQKQMVWLGADGTFGQLCGAVRCCSEKNGKKLNTPRAHRTKLLDVQRPNV